jgi:hypothetical protein
MTNFCIQIAYAGGILDEVGRTTYAWKTIAKEDDREIADAMVAIVGMGVGGDDGGFVARVVSTDELFEEGGAEAVREAEGYRDYAEAGYGLMLERIVYAVINSLAGQ